MEKKPMDYQKVNPVIHCLMISSLIIIFLTLLISWFLWFFLYRVLIELMLVSFSFTNFSIVTLLFSSLSLLLALPLIFLTKKNISHNFFALLSFILALVIVILNLFFYSRFKINNFLVVFLPWIIITIVTVLLFVISGINLIMNKNNFTENQEKKLIKERLENNENLFSSKTNTSNNYLANQSTNSISSTNKSVKLQSQNVTTNELEVSNLKQKKLNLDYKEVSNITDKYGENFTDLTVVLENNKIEKMLTEAKNKTQTENPVTNWSQKQIKQIWETADIIPGVNKDLYRKDYAGAWMFFSAFVAIPTKETRHNVLSYSWTIVNHKPLSQNGTNSVENLRPMNVINALTKGENFPRWKTKISSSGNENIIKEQIWSD